MSVTARSFKVYDLVWAKIADYPPWPGIVIQPDFNTPSQSKENMQWIYFLGSHHHDWVEQDQIMPLDGSDPYEFGSTCTHPYFKNAMIELDEIIANAFTNRDKLQLQNYTCLEKKYFKASDDKNCLETTNFTLETPSCSTLELPERSINSNVLQEEVVQIPFNDLNSDCLVASNEYVPDKPQDGQNGYSYSNEKEIKDVQIEVGDIQKNLTNDLISTRSIGILAGNYSCAEGITKNLIRSGYKIYVWSPLEHLCKELKIYSKDNKGGCKILTSPTQLVRKSDIIFSCLENSEHVKKMLTAFGIWNDWDDLLHGKAYVEMSNIDFETSKCWYDLIKKKGSAYLEAKVQISHTDADLRELIVLLAGDKRLFVEYQSIFKSIGHAFFLEEIGSATKIHSILQVMKGLFVAGLAECCAFIDRTDSGQMSSLREIFGATDMSSNFLNSVLNKILQNEFDKTGENSLQQIHESCLKLLKMSDTVSFPLPLASCVNQIFKQTRILGLGLENQDVASIYTRIRY